MKRQYRYRGSAILMVVGMVTIVAMLGTTLLVIAHLDARNSEALAGRAGADSVAWNVVSAIRGRLAADLVRGDYGPYGGVASITDDVERNRVKWLAYIDAPPRDDHAAEIAAAMDTWLYYDANPTDDPDANPDPTRHFSKLFAGPGRTITTSGTVNTDGRDDGPKDAFRVTTELMTESGKMFQISVKLEDLSARFCVNTAARPDGTNMPPATSMLSMNLREFLDDSNYTNLHTARCGGTAVDDMTKFDTDVVRKMFQPDTATVPYRPFGCGDEPYLRWFKPEAKTTVVGRLHEALDGMGEYRRGFLTTVSCSRSLRRRPDGPDDAQKLRMYLPDVDLETVGGRSKLYLQFLGILGLRPELRDDPDPLKLRWRKAAAHLVANLWAYTSADPTSSAFAFKPDDTFTVYGMVPQLVIAEAYAFSIPAVWSDPPDRVKLEDAGWAYAIELYNPTDYPVDTSDYVLKQGSRIWDFDNPSNPVDPPRVPRGGRLVLCTLGGFIDHDDDPGTGRVPAPANRDYFGFEGGHPWYTVPVLDFSGPSVPVRIVRIAGGAEVPIDSVIKEDIGYTVSNKQDDEGQVAVGQRYDEFDSARALVAVMKKLSSIPEFLINSGTAKTHDLNRRNRANDDAIEDITSAGARYGAPIYYSGEAMKDLGELALLHMVGPEQEPGKEGEDFPHSIKTPPYDDVKPSRGRFDLRPPSVAAAGWGADGDQEYPNVPFGALPAEFFELLVTDTTRKPDGRIYGRININTARKEVLRHLPWPGSIRIGGVSKTLDAAQIDRAIDYILAYRDKRQTADGLHDYSAARSGSSGSNITNLREDGSPAYVSNHRGFLTPAEVAIPLADYVHGLFGWTDYTTNEPKFVRKKDYVKERDKLYRAISNLITVNSDTYAANIRIDLRRRRDDGSFVVERTWHYVAVIDRSNCADKGDVPAVLLFTEVR